MSKRVLTFSPLSMPVTGSPMNDYPRARAESKDEPGSERESNEETELGFHKQAFPLIAPSCRSLHGSSGSLWPRPLWSPRVTGSHAWAAREAGPTQSWRTYLLINIKITHCSSEIVSGWIVSLPSLQFMLKSQPPVPENVTLLGNRGIAGVIK